MIMGTGRALAELRKRLRCRHRLVGAARSTQPPPHNLALLRLAWLRVQLQERTVSERALRSAVRVDAMLSLHLVDALAGVLRSVCGE